VLSSISGEHAVLFAGLFYAMSWAIGGTILILAWIISAIRRVFRDRSELAPDPDPVMLQTLALLCDPNLVIWIHELTDSPEIGEWRDDDGQGSGA
jgi:hypothetical protein